MNTKNNNKKTKKHSGLYIIIMGIGVLIIAMPICVFIYVRDFFKSKKWKKGTSSQNKYDALPLMPYREPKMPVNDKEFIDRIDEFICFQYKSLNALSGDGITYQLIADETPELKKYVLDFLKEHPIESLLYGKLESAGRDLTHWEMCFIFENQNLNHRIKGYGVTEDSSPFIRELVSYLLRK